MTKNERLARAVLLFHSGGYWTPALQNEWHSLDIGALCTTKALCDLAREILKEESQ